MNVWMEPRILTLLQVSLYLNQFKQIHTLIITAHPIFIPNLTHRLLKSPFIEYARQVFDQITHPHPSLYNSFISAYVKLSHYQQALKTFILMHCEGIPIDSYAISPSFKSCSSLSAVNFGKQIHSLAIHYGLNSNVFVQTALMDFYARTCDLDSAKRVFDGISLKDPITYNCMILGYSKYGDVLAARKLFDEMGDRTVVSWNSIISCYAQNGEHHEGLRVFEKMKHDRCHRPNETTVVTVLSMCAKLGDLEMGIRVKKYIDESNICLNMIVSTAILEMFIKCGAMLEARAEFDRMVKRDIVAWSSMISGYAQNGQFVDALDLFECMKIENIKSNDVALVSALSACSQLGSVETCERIGNYIESHELAEDLYVASALLFSYSKCGSIRKAIRMFNKMPSKDIVTWNSMLAGLAFNGLPEDAISLYGKLIDAELRPNEITFVGLLSACAHGGLVEQGIELFMRMSLDYGISPEIEHYACMVDLFCRSGKLKEAYELICRMDLEPNAVIWGTLLSSCTTHMNVELAELSVQKLLELEPENSGNYYASLLNTYASAGMWKEALKLRDLMKDNRVNKTAAYSWVDVGNSVHKFLVGDTSHPKFSDIFGIVNCLAIQSNWSRCDLVLEV